MASNPRRIILNTAKPIARDRNRPGMPIFTDAGSILTVPSMGLTIAKADAWLKDGSASEP